MALIKSRQAEHIVNQGSVLDFGDLNRQARELLEHARQDAAKIVEAAHSETRQLVETAGKLGHEEGKARGMAEGRDEGLRQGRAEALEQLVPQLEQIAGAWSEALGHWESQRSAMLLAAREDVLEFALAMGARITHRVVEADPSSVADQLSEALSLLARPGAVTVSIHPDDRPLVETVLPRLLERIAACEHVDLRDDPAVGRGGCVVAAGKGRIDATIERQIERVTEALLMRSSKEPDSAP